MASLNKEAQLAAAKQMISDGEKTVATASKLARPLIKQLVNADSNKDGTISRQELVDSLLAKGGAYPDEAISALKKMNCKPDDDAIRMIAGSMNITAKSIIGVLNNSVTIDERIQATLPVVISHFSQRTGVGEKDIDPAVKKFLESHVRQSATEGDRKLRDMYKQLRDAGEVGNLPRQYTPATPKDICTALSTKTT